MAKTDEAYSNTQDETSCKNCNVIELLIILTKAPSKTLHQALILSLENEDKPILYFFLKK